MVAESRSTHVVTVTLPASTVRGFLAHASMLSGAIHIASVVERSAVDTAYAGFFVLVAGLQMAVGLLMLVVGSRVVFRASLVNGVVIAIWMASRIFGVPFDAVETRSPILDVADVGTGVLQAMIVVGALKLLKNGATGRAPRPDARLGVGIASTATALALVVTLAIPALNGDSPVVPAEGGGRVVTANESGSRDFSSMQGARNDATHTVIAGDNFFDPLRLRIEVGDTVEWINRGQLPHTVSGDTGAFDSGTFGPAERFGFTFEDPGIYFYYCKLHGSPGKNGMWGVVTVASGNKKLPLLASRSAPASTGSSAPATFSVSATDNDFTPQELRVQVGDTVAWRNDGTALHNVVADSGSLASGDLVPGSTFSHTFTTQGV